MSHYQESSYSPSRRGRQAAPLSPKAMSIQHPRPTYAAPTERQMGRMPLSMPQGEGAVDGTLNRPSFLARGAQIFGLRRSASQAGTRQRTQSTLTPRRINVQCEDAYVPQRLGHNQSEESRTAEHPDGYGLTEEARVVLADHLSTQRIENSILDWEGWRQRNDERGRSRTLVDVSDDSRSFMSGNSSQTMINIRRPGPPQLFFHSPPNDAPSESPSYRSHRHPSPHPHSHSHAPSVSSNRGHRHGHTTPRTFDPRQTPATWDYVPIARSGRSTSVRMSKSQKSMPDLHAGRYVPHHLAPERLPRPPHMTAGRERKAPIFFTTNNKLHGVRIRDILKKRVVLDRADSRPMPGKESISIAFNWPGYERFDRSKPIRIDARSENDDDGGLSLGSLAYIIALELDQHMRDLADYTPSSHCSKWTVGEHAIWIEDVTLVSLNYYQHAWVPELLIKF